MTNKRVRDITLRVILHALRGAPRGSPMLICKKGSVDCQLAPPQAL
jgi:hypothetical protein